MPSVEEFKQAGQTSLIAAVNKHGGSQTVAQRLGSRIQESGLVTGVIFLILQARLSRLAKRTALPVFMRLIVI